MLKFIYLLISFFFIILIINIYTLVASLFLLKTKYDVIIIFFQTIDANLYETN